MNPGTCMSLNPFAGGIDRFCWTANIPSRRQRRLHTRIHSAICSARELLARNKLLLLEYLEYHLLAEYNSIFMNHKKFNATRNHIFFDFDK